MGAKSTMSITRADALKEIFGMLLKADDETLANVLEDLNDGSDDPHLGLLNFSIVSDYNEDHYIKYRNENK